MKAPFDSRQLRAFVTLARTGSFTVTAKTLFVSQSAVSHSMKALEEDVGCRLLDRVGKKVALTQAGEQLFQHAEKVLDEMAQARASLEYLGKWGSSRLRLGASSSACQYILPPVLRRLKEKFPQASIGIEAGDTSEAVEKLHKNEIDLALVLMPSPEEQCDFRPLFSDEMLFLVDPSHAWAQKGSVTREEIPWQNYILYNKTSYTFRLVEEFFREDKTVLKSVIQFGSMEAIKELVKLGLGISILAPWIAREELEQKTLVALPLGKRKLKRTWGIAHRRGRHLNIAEETFVQLCREVASKIVQE
jgi:LysR family transcriptional regulator, low CO2-responsive transcriptional regulator